LKNWFRKIGAPIDLSEGDIPAEDIPAIAENATMLAQKWGLDEYTKEVIIDILQRCD
jgi:alcohol dehydrogenase YqhD (iron-dependent ADH family)